MTGGPRSPRSPPTLPGLAAMITVDYLGAGWDRDGPALPVPVHCLGVAWRRGGRGCTH